MSAMAEDTTPDSKWCSNFFLYDASKVTGEGDPTRDGICYFYPEETPLDQQELLCGQLAGVCRCVSELSHSPVQLLRLRRCKFAIRMRADFLWALGCAVDIPDISICSLLDQLISLFSFYNGPIRQSYQLRSREELALQWAQYLSHLQGGATELHHIFSSLRTMDSEQIDPLLLLKAALILQACQRCPLVLAGCIFYHNRVVSSQMPPDVTAKVLVHDSDMPSQDLEPETNAASGSAPLPSSVTTTPVFLSPVELHALRCPPVERKQRSTCVSQLTHRTGKPRLLSRTLSDTPNAVRLPVPGRPRAPCQTNPCSTRSSLSDESGFSPGASLGPTGPSLFSPVSQSVGQSSPCFPANPEASGVDLENGPLLTRDKESEEVELPGPTYKCGMGHGEEGENQNLCKELNNTSCMKDVHNEGKCNDDKDIISQDWRRETPACIPMEGELPLVAMALYRHRVRDLMLALLVEPHFCSDNIAVEEVYHSSLASLNGLEAHLRNPASDATSTLGALYTFAHYDCLQNTLSTNLLSANSSGAPESQGGAFVRATTLLHTQFSQAPLLQEVIVRNAGSAVYGTRGVAQETYFLQQGATVRNSGIPNPQDSAFSLPTKARHRLLKHGVNLL